MKRTLLILLSLALSLTFTTHALTANNSVPPKSVCLIDSLGYNYSLTIKLAGKVKMADGPVKFYNISGAVFYDTVSRPITGTGYVKGTQFHFSITGNNYVEPSPAVNVLYTLFVEGYWDLADKTNPVGNVYLREISNYTDNVWSATLSLMDCSTEAIPN
jgi:hypothetical protein